MLHQVVHIITTVFSIANHSSCNTTFKITGPRRFAAQVQLRYTLFWDWRGLEFTWARRCAAVNYDAVEAWYDARGKIFILAYAKILLHQLPGSTEENRWQNICAPYFAGDTAKYKNYEDWIPDAAFSWGRLVLSKVSLYVVAVLQTSGVSAIWVCHSKADVDSSVLVCDSV